MTSAKSLFAGLLLTASVAVVPAASAAVNVHVVGAGSSAQYTVSAIAADQLAVNNAPSGQCPYHYTASNSGNMIDNRDKLGRITPELGNLWVVWLAACSDTTGATNVTDIWLDLSVDSTVGVRGFLASQPDASHGAYIQVVTPPPAPGNKVSPSSLWPDNKADVALPAAVYNVIGTNAAGTGDVQVNVGLTDIRPEDALFATTRSIAALNTTTYAGLGYVGPTTNIGAPILTAQGTGTSATPIKFKLTGNDPISLKPVRAFTTIPIGAAPIVFVYNNGGAFDPNAVNLVSGVKGDGTAGTAGHYLLANLFDGTTACSTGNAALGGGGSQSINLILREPLSGTMNTTEFSVFRTTGNTKDSQEVGVINPTRSPYNPLNLACAGGGGSRQRAIGTGEVVSAVQGHAHTLGYIFYGFANVAKLSGASFQYLLVDGVDPIALPGTTNQQLPSCTTTNCPATLWSGNLSFPNLRNGTYKAWSIYRWLVDTSNDDPLGPAALAQSSQDLVDSTIADFVPFKTSTGSDGLEVYRSHFVQSAIQPNNGDATAANTLDGGNSLGGDAEAGGDEGGVIVGRDNATVITANGTGTTAGKGKVTWKTGHHFGLSAADGTHLTGNPAALVGKTVSINGANFVVAATPAPTTTILYTTTQTGAHTTPVPFSVYISPTSPGLLKKKQ
jgi:hypothetical protein